MSKAHNPGLGSLCVGRESELARLRSLYERANNDGGHCILVRGDSGVGKSRLLLEYKRRARLDGICVLEGRCRSDRRAYQPFLEIVREASSYLADLAPALFQASRTMEILEGLSGDSAGGGDLRFERWEDRRTALYESVGDLLQTVGQVRPPTVIIHDIQLADEDTRGLLGHLLGTLASARALQGPSFDARFNGLFVLSERTNGAENPAVRKILSGVSHTLLPLDGLDRAGVEAFLSAPSVISRFIEVTGGNPRQIEAFIERHHDHADKLLIARITALPASAKQLTAALAVLGRPANPRTLGRIAALKASDLGQATDRLLKAEVLVSSIRDGALELAFKSSSDQDALLASLEAEERAELHQRAGEEMLTRGDDVCAAEHLLQGTEGEQAAEIALRAGERLEIAFAYERAIDLYERATDRTSSAELKHELEERLCDLLELTGEYERAVELTERLVERAPDSSRLRRRLGHLFLQQGDFSRARECLNEALTLLQASRDSATEKALNLSDLAEVAYLKGEHREAMELVERVQTCDTDETPVPSIKARNTLGKIHLERGEYDAAAKLFHQNLELSRAANVIPEEIRALINLGISHLRQGRYEEAADCYRAGLSASEASSDYRHRAFCLQNLGVLAHWRRDYTSALQLFHDAVQTFLKLGHKSWLSWLALDLGDLYLELGEPVRAESMLELSSSLVNEINNSQTPLFANLLQGKLAAFDGRWSDAEEHFTTTRDKALSAEKSDEAATASLELARLMLRTDRPEAAASLAAEWTEAPTRKTRAEAQALLGEAGLRGAVDEDATARALKAAQSLYERVGDAFGLWAVMARRAEHAQRLGDRHAAEKLLKQAERIEARVRKTVPEEFRESYLAHPRRQPLLALLGIEGAAPAPAVESASTPTGAIASFTARRLRGALRRTRPAHYDKRYGQIIGEHEEILRVLDLVDKIAPLDSTVLIRGESGTGKELVAEALHRHSSRAKKPYVKVNCGALVESLLLSELFGHERGAFTGASRRKKGRFEVADSGTIFLDEIGDITPKTQVALLRVLQEKEFERVGGNTPIRVNVRIVCATNRDLEQMVQEGTFREDLYYRLKAFQIDVPPLRKRSTDIILMAHHFLGQMTADGECPPRELHRDAEPVLMQWRWPGNVRELQNVLRSVSLLAENDILRAPDFREFIPQEGSPVSAVNEHGPGTAAAPLAPSSTAVSAVEPAEAEKTALADPYEELISEGISLHEYKKKIEAECIAQALRETDGNITRAAALLGMKRPRLSQLVKQYGLSG